MAASGKRLTASQEDYLEAIWTLIWKEGIARVRDIANHLDVSTPSVSGALKSLAKHGLVEYTPHKYVTLSDRGMQLAAKISARHGMLHKFLVEVLDLNDQLADSNACRIEHAVDEVVSRRLGYFVTFASQNPLAKQWADEFRVFCAQQEAAALPRLTSPQEARVPPDEKEKGLLTLADIEAGRKAKVLSVGGSAAVNRRLTGTGMERGAIVSVIRVAPLGDPIEIKLRGQNVPVRKAEALDVEVERLD
jgi:DtxR family Mn-dependent transcriptional regulator